MYHGKLNITLSGKELKLHFNNYSDFEVTKIFGKENLIDNITEKVQENELAFIADLIWIGTYGYREATLTDTQMTRVEIRKAISEGNAMELAEVSKAFFDHLGQNLEIEKTTPEGEKKN